MNASIVNLVENMVKELLFLRTQINYVTVKGEESNRMILESLSCVTDAILSLTVVEAYLKTIESNSGKEPTETQSDGCSHPVIWTL
jgi:hypothetical protein